MNPLPMLQYQHIMKWSQKRIVALLALLCILVAIGIAAGAQPSKEVEVTTITLTENGFEPQEVSISKGETVRFDSKLTDREFWPASNQHPTHGLLPAFDPKRPLAPNESWTFTFDTLGAWPFHDHLASQNQGTVYVGSSYAADTESCLDRGDASAEYIQAACWVTEFEQLVDEGGMNLVFETFNEYMNNDALFKRNCHDIMHFVGDIAYAEYRDHGTLIDRPETAYCGYGFYHGFIERMIAEHGSYEGSRAYCDALAESDKFLNTTLAGDAASACRHGFGHAVFDSLDGTLYGDDLAMTDTSLNACEAIFPDDVAQAECATGVTNALSIAYTRNYYELSFPEEDPLQVCAGMRELYQSGCYLDVGVFYVVNNDLSYDEAIAFFEKEVPGHAFPRVIKAFAADNVQWRTEYEYQDIKEEADRCFAFTDTHVVNECMYGIHLGIYKKNEPQTNQQESQKVCDLYTDTHKRSVCEENILRKL